MWVCTVHPMTQLGPNHIWKHDDWKKERYLKTCTYSPFLHCMLYLWARLIGGCRFYHCRMDVDTPVGLGGRMELGTLSLWPYIWGLLEGSIFSDSFWFFLFSLWKFHSQVSLAPKEKRYSIGYSLRNFILFPFSYWSKNQGIIHFYHLVKDEDWVLGNFN